MNQIMTQAEYSLHYFHKSLPVLLLSELERCDLTNQIPKLRQSNAIDPNPR